MGLANRVSRLVAFLRAGYPAAASPTGYAPLLALLPRRVSDDEVGSIATRLLGARPPVATGADVVDRADIAVAITRVTDEMPLLDDIARVRTRLAREPGY